MNLLYFFLSMCMRLSLFIIVNCDQYSNISLVAFCKLIKHKVRTCIHINVDFFICCQQLLIDYQNLQFNYCRFVNMLYFFFTLVDIVRTYKSMIICTLVLVVSSSVNFQRQFHTSTRSMECSSLICIIQIGNRSSVDACELQQLNNFK